MLSFRMEAPCASMRAASSTTGPRTSYNTLLSFVDLLNVLMVHLSGVGFVEREEEGEDTDAAAFALMSAVSVAAATLVVSSAARAVALLSWGASSKISSEGARSSACAIFWSVLLLMLTTRPLSYFAMADFCTPIWSPSSCWVRPFAVRASFIFRPISIDDLLLCLHYTKSVLKKQRVEGEWWKNSKNRQEVSCQDIHRKNDGLPKESMRANGDALRKARPSQITGKFRPT